MLSIIRILLACSIAASATAQLSLTYGPADAPLGCPVHLTLSNDTTQSIVWDPCGFSVVDAAGALVYVPPCAGVVTLLPGEVFTHTWPQLDNAGMPVAPGTYFFGDTSGVAIQVGSAETGIAALGAPVTGTARSFQLCSPQDPGAPFLLLASGASFPGVATCGGVIPLRRDRLFRLSLSSPGVFRAFHGTLDGAGGTTLPTLAIPDRASLMGTNIVLAFLVLDPSGACRVKRISTTFEFQIR